MSEYTIVTVYKSGRVAVDHGTADKRYPEEEIWEDFSQLADEVAKEEGTSVVWQGLFAGKPIFEKGNLCQS